MSEESSAQARFRGLADRASLLIDWYKQNKPKVTWVRVTDEELGLLRKFPDIAKSYGFHAEDGRIYYDKFEVIGVSGSPSPVAVGVDPT